MTDLSIEPGLLLFDRVGSSEEESESTGLPELRYAVAPITDIEVKEPSESYDNTWKIGRAHV